MYQFNNSKIIVILLNCYIARFICSIVNLLDCYMIEIATLFYIVKLVH